MPFPYGLSFLKLTKEVDCEVCDMCSYADAMENKGVEIGEEKGIEKGLKALVRSLKEYTCDFDGVYNSVIKNEDYSKVTKDQVMKYFKD